MLFGHAAIGQADEPDVLSRVRTHANSINIAIRKSELSAPVRRYMDTVPWADFEVIENSGVKQTVVGQGLYVSDMPGNQGMSPVLDVLPAHECKQQFIDALAEVNDSFIKAFDVEILQTLMIVVHLSDNMQWHCDSASGALEYPYVGLVTWKGNVGTFWRPNTNIDFSAGDKFGVIGVDAVEETQMTNVGDQLAIQLRPYPKPSVHGSPSTHFETGIRVITVHQPLNIDAF